MGDPSTPSTDRQTLIQRLKERKLVQWTLAYVAGSWVALEVVSTLQDGLGWSSGLFSVLVVVLAVGFVVTLVLAWYHGEQGRQRVSGPELLIITGILVVSGLLVSVLRSPREAPDATTDEEQMAPAGAQRPSRARPATGVGRVGGHRRRAVGDRGIALPRAPVIASATGRGVLGGQGLPALLLRRVRARDGYPPTHAPSRGSICRGDRC